MDELPVIKKELEPKPVEVKPIVIEQFKPSTTGERINHLYEILSGINGVNIEDAATNMAEQTEFIYNELNKRMFKKSKKSNKYKFKMSIRAKLKRVAKKGKILLIILRINKKADVKIISTMNGYFVLDGVPRLYTDYYVFLMDGKIPTIIIPEWDIEPIKNKTYFDAGNELSIAAKESFIIGVTQSNQVKMGGGMTTTHWVFIVLAILAGLYVLFGGAITGGG